MKPIVLFIGALILCNISNAQSLSDFEWLNGKWERQNTKPGSTAFESWEKVSDSFSGIGLTMKGLDTVFVENLKILKKEDDFYYVAKVSHNPSPTFF